jgi:hypothetical protein
MVSVGRAAIASAHMNPRKPACDDGADDRRLLAARREGTELGAEP